MKNEETQTLLAYGKKFVNSQYDPVIVVDGIEYRNIDLLTIYKIQMMYELDIITEEKKNELIDLYHRNLAGNKLDDDELKSIHNKLEEYYLLPEDLELDYLVYGSVIEEKELKKVKEF